MAELTAADLCGRHIGKRIVALDVSGNRCAGELTRVAFDDQWGPVVLIDRRLQCTFTPDTPVTVQEVGS